MKDIREALGMGQQEEQLEGIDNHFAAMIPGWKSLKVKRAKDDRPSLVDYDYIEPLPKALTVPEDM